MRRVLSSSEDRHANQVGRSEKLAWASEPINCLCSGSEGLSMTQMTAGMDPFHVGGCIVPRFGR